MKRQVTIFVIISFILALSPALVQAQETETDIKKKELEDKKKKEAELIKKLQIEEQKRQTDEWEGQRGIMVLENAIHEEELQKAVEEARAAISFSRDFDGALDNYYVYTGAEAPNIYWGGSQNGSSIQYTKSVKEGNFTKNLSFEVEDDAHKAAITVSGSCKMGEIRIKIIMPNGKPYTEVLIDEYGSVNWSKSFSIDEENEEKTGEWKFIISAKDASGNFRLSLRSY
jgi:hypothetical protein